VITRIEDGLRGLFESPLPPRVAGVAPYPVRRSEAVVGTQLAKGYTKEYDERVATAWRQLMEYLKNGVFRLPRKVIERGRGEVTDGGGGGSGDGGSGGDSSKRRLRRRAPNKKEAALVGQEFEEEGIDWKVIGVSWSDDFDELVVFYYDEDGVTDEELAEIEELDDYFEYEHDAVEHSRVSEVVTWIKEPDRAATGTRGGRGRENEVNRDRNDISKKKKK
jgi:hypothetical protein